jgi:hypothetical protein
MAGQIVTGASSGTTAQIIAVSQFNQGSDSIVEFTLRKDSVIGSGFSASEVIEGVSTSGDFTMQFTIQSVVTSITAGDFGGILYNVGDILTLDSNIGNGQSTAQVSEIKTGSVSDIHIDVVGVGYSVGDSVKFTNFAGDSSNNPATAFVSVIGGRLSTEASTSTTPEALLLESGTKTSFVGNKLLLNGSSVATVAGEPYAVFGTDRRFSDSQTYYFPLYLTEARAEAANTTTGIAHPHLFDQYPGTTFWMPSDNQNHAKSTFNTTLYNLFVSTDTSLDDGFVLRQESGNVATGMDSETDSNTEVVLGGSLLSEDESLSKDSYGTDTDGIILEEASFFSVDESSEINRIFLVNGGSGYSKLPSLTVNSESGTDAELVALTKDIGMVTEISVTDSGFKYATKPDVVANTNLIVKDVSGSFAIDSALTTHTGNVVSWEPSINKLVVDTTPTNRLTGESAGLTITNDGLQLEDFDIVEPDRPDHGPIATVYKVNDEFGQGVLLDAFSEKGKRISIDTAAFGEGELLQDATEVNVYQISMEIDDMDIPIDEGIELEAGVFVPTDSSGKFLLDSHRLKSRRRSERFEDHVKLEDEAAGTNIFGEQEEGELLYNFSMNDVGDNIALEVQTSGGTDLGNYIVMLETSTENDGDRLELDGSGFTDGDLIEYQLGTSIVFGNNTDSILLENSLPDGNGSPSYLVNEDQGNAIILNTSGGQDNTDDANDKLLQSVIDVSEISNFGRSVKHSNTPAGRLMGEGLETFVNESSPVNNLNVEITSPTKSAGILYEETIYSGDEDGYGNIITEDDDRILNENSGHNLLLDGTDSSSTNADSQIIMEDETGIDQVILNQTQSDGTDSGDEIIMESAFDVVGDTITDSSGASAVVIAQGTAQGVTEIGTTVTKPGAYVNTDSLLGEDIIRIQDSYFYQQFSYEVKVNAVLSDYINELKASVHPAGFIPFGKVSLATQISAALGTAAAGVIDYTGDDTFTPELASLFGVVFGETLQMTTAIREGVLDTTGGSSIFDTIIQENGVAIGDLILEETDGDNLQFESGLDIAAENSQSSGDGSILLDAGAGSGRLLAETALGENGISKRSVSHVTTIKVRPEIKTPKVGYGAPLASGILPGSIFFDQPMIQLEDGLSNGLPAITEDNLVFDGTDKDGTDSGDRISYEINPNEQAGIKLSDLPGLSIKDLVEMDTIGFTEPAGTLKTNEGGIVFEQSAASDELVLEDYMHFILEGGRLSDVLLLENGHTLLQESNSQPFTLEDNLQAFPDGTNELTHIRLETATDSTGLLVGEGIQAGDNSINIVLDGQLNRGEKILTEGSKIEFEDSTNQGSIPEGNFGNKNITQFTREARIDTETSTNRLSLQDEYEIGFNVALEDDSGVIIFDGTSAVLDIEGQILLDGTDSAKSNAGDAVVQDTAANENDNLLLDSSGGRDLGDKLVMFDTIRNQVADNEGGFFLLNGTDGDGTNAGDELSLEASTLSFLTQNSINIANGLAGELGGIQLPVSESDTGTGVAVVTNFDSSVGTFDSALTTFDAA